MKSLNFASMIAAGALIAIAAVPCVISAQNLESSQILHPSADSWPLYHGDYSGKRHSSLTQITPQNVGTLTLSWAFQTNQPAQIKSSPLLVDGILYFTVPDNVWAVDARSGHMLWHFNHPTTEGDHIGHRGVAMYKGWLYFTTPDAHLLSLNAKDGTLRWDKVIADVKKGYWSTMAPLVVKDHIIAGVGGDLDNLPGMLRSFDPDTGALQWEWDATAPTGTPKGTTGGTTWMTGTYDPELNLIYWGTGNPTPVLNGATRPGDDPWTCSIVALNPDTGKLAWGFVASPHDTHDWDAVETPVLVDADFHGQPRKMLMQSSRNGYFFVLDRTTGKSLLTTPFGPTNWAKGVDAEGHPIPDTDKEPAPDGRLIAPDEGGMTNYRAPSFDIEDGLWGKGVIEAIDYQTGKIRWTHDVGNGGSGAGVLTTASGLTFTGDGIGNVIALDSHDGKTLWHAGSGAGMQSSPISYELDGRQYIMTSSGTLLFAWALPQNPAPQASK